MSSNTQGLSGRDLAKARRQAQTKGKGTPIVPKAHQPIVNTSASVKSSEPVRSESFAAPARSRNTVATATPVVNEGRKAAVERRKQLVKGSGYKAKSQPTRQPRQKRPVEPITSEASAPVQAATAVSTERTRKEVKAKSTNVKTMGSVMPKGRLVARTYRKAQSEGKAALKAKLSGSSSVSSIAKMANPDANGRQIAREVRHQRCTQGKTSSGVCRPTGKVSRKPATSEPYPAKVGFSQTGYDQTVSGTMVSDTNKMTGSESGACRVISGTEYTSPDEFQAKCSFKPEANPRKVSVTSTASGRHVSGTEVGLSEKVTGTEPGQCRGVTGTEYLPADQGEMFCGSKPEAGPVKVSQSRTVKNQTISGPSMQAREAMTGLEPGAERSITGSQYLSYTATPSKEPSRQARPSIMSVPTKVDVSETSSGNQVSGTNVNFYKPVTGDEAGFCKDVSGNEYQSNDVRVARCGDSLQQGARKVVESKTFVGQRITGDRAGLGGKVTGAGAGRCKSVTGSNYQSLDAAEECDLPIEKVKPDYMNRPGVVPKPTTGTQPGPMGLTGAQQGVCSSVSGTPYQGVDQTSAMCQNSVASVPGESDFPVLMNPASMQAISQPMMMPMTAPSVASPGAEITEDLSSKITGDGADRGFSITGDSWGRASSVTGTEGRWAKGRNVSMKGNGSKSLNLARDFRPETNPKVAESSPITGSSGNTKQGASVTVSGGARA
ncbi:CsoS2 family carboxysome shell protein [Thiomicrospira sp. ALE5]|uniref:CsoS2 family carboxysome shell protein n=1 Tax=Thiomicrospira sp. ALE5 TaxID=748650 RepID=UPI0008F000FE|nr:CsoS2 family carboxysome shell protein [Thiomicrospira sp. ALE5]SFR55780.1 Carboxysome shell peptide mid-region [Thiomicrospira sp. ALE5]